MAAAAETLADEFDRDLYRLICRADALAERGVKPHKGKWRDVYLALSKVRPTVRSMMDPRDREATTGTI